jgi:hypothetical protein
VLFAEAVLGDMTLLLAMKALVQILLFPIILIISLFSLISRWTFLAFTGFTTIITITTFATLLLTEQSFWREPSLSLDRHFLFNELGDDLIGHGSHCGIFVNSEVQ